MDSYKKAFRDFVINELSDFYDGIGEFYKDRGGNPDSLTYFENHFPRFKGMIEIGEGHIDTNTINNVCEIGSFYPYTSYYYKWLNESIAIDLYDIILRELRGDVRPYNVRDIKLIDFNLCTERLPGIQYDVVILSEVMEHLPINLFAFEKEIIRILKPNGYLISTYPLGGRNAKGYGRLIGGRDLERLQEDHVREFTRETVDLFFKDLRLVKKTDVRYRAYGLIQICLHQA